MVRLEVSIQTFQSGESKPGNGPSFEQGICKSYYEQQRTAKEFADQLCSRSTEMSRSVTHRVDQSASHRADKEVHSAHTRTRRSQEFTRSLELAKHYRLCVTSVDYRTEVNCRFVCKCHDDDIIVMIAHKPKCLKNGDICKYTRNGTQVCSHILYVLRLNQIAYTTSELKSMLAKFATKSPSHVLVGQASSAPAPTKKSSEWKLQRMPLQGGPKPKCKGCSKRVFKTGDLCVAVIGKYTPKHKDKDGNHFEVDATYRYCHKLCCIAKSSLPAPKRILLDSDLQLTPEELDSLKNLPIVST